MPYALRRGHLGKLCTIVLFSFATPGKMYSRSERCILEGETREKRKENKLKGKESCSRGGREHGLRDVSRSRLLLSELSATDLSDEWNTVIPLRTKCLDRRSDKSRLLSVDRCWMTIPFENCWMTWSEHWHDFGNLIYEILPVHWVHSVKISTYSDKIVAKFIR